MKNLINLQKVIGLYKSEVHAKKALEQYHNRFPIKSSITLAGTIADLMGDGHLQGEPNWRMDYTSNSKKELNRFGKEMFKLFGVCGKIRNCNTNKYGTMNYGVNCKPLARILHFCGAPSGAKVLKTFDIPTWITENKEYFKKFISRLFSCEATVDKAGYIEIQMHKSTDLIARGFTFFYQIKNNLEKHFGIKTTKPFTDNAISIRKDRIITKPIRLKIKRKQSVKLFAEKICFEDKAKQAKLLRVIK